MLFLYNILTHFSSFFLKLIAPFEKKIRLGVNGRSLAFSQLKSALSKDDNTVWFHCASLGEYEQGVPVFEEIKKLYPNHKIVLSFFSPSGYENKKNTTIADQVVYLPLDTKRNAKKFMDLVNPQLVVFVKYDIWPNYLREIQHRRVKSILISANFRKEQFYFKPLGRFVLKSLTAFEKIFVQNEATKSLLAKFGILNTVISGDTRFDRVTNQLSLDNSLDFVEKFKGDKLCVIAGSTWPEDEELLIQHINDTDALKVKYIIAPHDIKSKRVDKLQSMLNKRTILFSDHEQFDDLNNFDVLILNTVGLLSKAYSYCNIAYVGGALGETGLHNTLEPAVFGIPIIIGSHFEKFPEAIEMTNRGGMVSISNLSEFNSVISNFLTNDFERANAGRINKEFVEENAGAVIQIMNFLRI